jgi:hypothetical protein
MDKNKRNVTKKPKNKNYKGKKNLASEIIESQNAIRKKYKKFMVKQEAERDYMTKTLQPITEPLFTLMKASAAAQNVEKILDSNKGTTQPSDEAKTIANQSQNKSKNTTPNNANEKETEKTKEKVLIDRLLEQYFTMHSNPLSSPELDKSYGLRHSGNRWYLGDSVVNVNDRDIIIKGTTYKGSPGLYELLFLKNPDDTIYNESDLETYRQMLLATHAHKQRFEQSKQVNSNKGPKYVNIIKKLLTKTGAGMCLNSVRYEYWDDPNELVERLRLLIASKQAGNTSVENEILSIIEELREAGIIE